VAVALVGSSARPERRIPVVVEVVELLLHLWLRPVASVELAWLSYRGAQR
jgi:hypothetical protein